MLPVTDSIKSVKELKEDTEFEIILMAFIQDSKFGIRNISMPFNITVPQTINAINALNDLTL